MNLPQVCFNLLFARPHSGVTLPPRTVSEEKFPLNGQCGHTHALENCSRMQVGIKWFITRVRLASMLPPDVAGRINSNLDDAIKSIVAAPTNFRYNDRKAV
jgi:hypothetical protein